METLNGAAVLKARPNWREKVKVEWEYKTEIFETRDGTEQRRAMRAKPRRRVEFQNAIFGAAGRGFRMSMAHGAHALSVIEDVIECRYINSPSGTQATVLSVSGMPYWAVAGGGIVVTTGGNQQFRTIALASGSSITVDSAVLVADGTTVAPVVIGRIDEGQSYKRLTAGVGQTSLAFVEEPTEMPNPINRDTDPDSVYHGFPVARFRPNWANETNENFRHRFDSLDYGYGKTFTYLIEPQARWEGSMTCIGRDKDEVDRAQAFFHRRKGRLGAFYMPTWQEDMSIISGATPASETIVVEGTDAHDLFNGSMLYRNLAFVTPEDFVPVGIEDVIISGGNTHITLDSPLPVAAADTAYISWLMMVRFASDQFAVTWTTNEVAEFDFSVVSLLVPPDTN